ncbi:glycogen debranching enzyme-like isoform X1 [Haliotis rufescens]|uniref:glycogen debranching enzyme-like isoform X1 n=1 Tax=Haliotis rufescens TaxID=6454 RepID=UPI00201FB347|nr:glycogen debranching enzyme-like isoform X1 [Haliotis rufescens]XP_046327924.2 glycogen debranching enzyme-like isoform X1 [Haliotis rufescens]XP_046327925.2 glycogen debranching enzyme-like isoform X1 [Haliotis rufescens]
MPVTQARVLTLNRGENRETTLYRLEKGWTLRFALGPSLLSASVRLYCNHPPSSDKTFKRTTYYELPWRSPSGMSSDRHDVFAEVNMGIAGSFNYFFTVDGSDVPSSADGQGYFLVDPTLHVGSDNVEITLDCIQCQTVITKLLGPFSQWENRLRVAKETGYNLIHFTPIQELGISNSAYSIRDQRILSPVYNDHQQYSYKDVKTLVETMQNDWQVLALTDLVFNHTSKDSPWVLEHPECAYNLENAAHLMPAYVMDRILSEFSDEVAKKKWVSKGVPSSIDDESQLQAIRHVLLTEVFPRYRLQEFYTVSVDGTLKEFKRGIEENRHISESKEALDIIQDPQYRRLKSKVDPDTVLKLYNVDSEDGNHDNRPGVLNRQERITKCCDSLRARLNELNGAKERDIEEIIKVAVENFVANVRWRFLDPNGPQVGTVTGKKPLMHSYFVWPESHSGTVDWAEQKVTSGEGARVMAVNGWVMGDDPLKNFAEEGSNVYIRRELLAWGDSVKLRYGQKPEDCPYLWNHMRDYAETTARIFHGVRLDNCHSTPIHVAEYMLDAARKVQPDLYVIAELFTGGEHLDNLFINRLGINSLIREALMAWDAHEEGRLVHRYGGVPVGSFVQPRIQPLVQTMAHAIFFDQTHDNPSPIAKRSAYDLWPTAALVSMAFCATGSNRGYDQLVPHHIHVVKEERLYPSWTEAQNPDASHINKTFGITLGKRMLNQLHYEMGMNGFTQVYVDQLDPAVVSVTRHNPRTHESIVLVSRTAFQNPDNPDDTGYIRPITVEGIIEEIIFEGRMRSAKGYTYEENKEFINGLPEYYLELREHVKVEDSGMVKVKELGDKMEVSFASFTPGSVVAFRSSLRQPAKNAILEIRRGLGQFGYLMRSYSGHTMFDESWDTSNFRAIVSTLSLADLNRVLYRVDAEERDDGNGFGSYHIPNHGDLIYCGLRGIISLLAEIRPQNDLGHPLCKNLRTGDWLAEYTANRLKVHHGTEKLGAWFDAVFSYLKKVPRYLVPCYFDAIVTGAYVVLQTMVVQQLSDFIRDGSTFVQALAMGSVQLCGFVKTSMLPPLSPDLAVPPARREVDLKTGEEIEATLSLAAGFPHFSSGYMRNWGRDTFIALRGLLLLTGRYQEARCLILAYGGTLRHGLIPNLLNEGTGARYNCRDAIWWWLQAIQEYTKLVPGGSAILQDKVSRLYPTDDSEALPPGAHDQPLCDVIQEALRRHAEGIKYRERNAGHQIDSEMTDPGFTVEVGVRWETGFVYGGNEHNCGTWMDKMGSSLKADNKGKPATPRDGSAVELVGLSLSTLRWLAQLHTEGLYPYSEVTASDKGHQYSVSFTKWADKIKDNFEKCFWISKFPEPKETTPELINRRPMYKDSYHATQFWANFQLRPNFAVAMVVAPELFDVDNAWSALETAGEVLLGPLGMKTLDSRDWGYEGDYDNANDGDNTKLARGWNYHQGPEWVWPIGYFLRAKLYFASVLEKTTPGVLKETVNFVETALSQHYKEVMTSAWQSLPELTNSNGSYCRDSCRAQAWSTGCVLEVLYDLEMLQKDKAA